MIRQSTKIKYINMNEQNTHYNQPPRSPQSDEIDLVELIKPIWAHRVQIAIFVFACSFIMAIATFFMNPVYTANTVFICQDEEKGGGAVSGLSSLAGQFGFGFDGGGVPLVDVMPKILNSREFFEPLLDEKLVNPETGEKTGLENFLMEPEIQNSYSGDTLVSRLHKAFTDKSKISKDKDDGSFSLSVNYVNPDIAALLANFITKELNEFYMNFRLEKKDSNVEFLQERVNDANKELKKASAALRKFREKNQVVSSPALMEQQEWFLRDVKVAEEKYLLLRKEFETAKIEKEKAKPVITIIDKAHAPLVRTKPKRKLLVIIAALFSAFLSFLLTIMYERYRDYFPSGVK